MPALAAPSSPLHCLVADATIRSMKPEQIKRIRHRLKMTQEQFAPLLPVNRVTLARWESGTCVPLPVYIAILKTLDRKEKKGGRDG